MEKVYVGSTPWSLGSVYIHMKDSGKYTRFYIYDTMFGMTWNSISFVLTQNEFTNMINHDIGFNLLLSDLNSHIIHQVNSMKMNVDDNGKITSFEISYDDYKVNSFLSNLFKFDTKKIRGRNFTQLIERPTLFLE